MGARVGIHWTIIENIIRSWCIYMTYKCGKKLYKILCFKGDLYLIVLEEYVFVVVVKYQMNYHKNYN